MLFIFFFFSSRRRHTRYWRDWSSDVCSSDLLEALLVVEDLPVPVAEDVRRVPPREAEHPGLQARGDDRLHQGLPGLEVLAGYGDARSSAKSTRAGISAARDGAPLG